MAEMEWTRPVAAPTVATSPLAYAQRFAAGLFDWETVITLFLALGAVTAVSAPLEDGGWRKDMPPLTTVAVISVITGMLMARSRMSAVVAWPLGVLAGVGVIAWQTLLMAGPGTLHDRLWAVHDRFASWFHVIDSNAVTNDPLPFNVLILSLTWLGVMVFIWSVYRWHNAWIGLIPGGAALFLDLTLVGDNLTGAIVLYMLFGFLLVMQTNLLANIRIWRREGTEYPAMINLTFLHFSLWALVILMAAAWVVPAGLRTPGPVQGLAEDSLQFASRYVRLAGPLQSHKVIPIHSYSGVLPFQGSINLGDRELMTATVTDPKIAGTLLLRGTTYEQYEGGGWSTVPRESVSLPPDQTDAINEKITQDASLGTLVPLHIQMKAKTVAGTVVYVPGEPVWTSRGLQVQVPQSAVQSRDGRSLPFDGIHLNDPQVFAATLSEGQMGVGVDRDANGAVNAVHYLELNDLGLLADGSVLDPGGRIKRYDGYDITGFIPTTTPEGLRAAGTDYPAWVQNDFLQLPDSLPARVQTKAMEAYNEYARKHPDEPYPTTPYDKAVAIQNFLRDNYGYDLKVPETPAGRDNVDFFLFDMLRGYFDYHASAMVVLLRTQGIPARLAVGFVVDDTNRDGVGAYVVKDKNSYAWPEVYFPGYGWVPFNPTPDRDSNVTPRTDASAALGGTDHNIADLVPAAVSGNDPGLGDTIDQTHTSNTPVATTGNGTQPLEWYVSAAITAFIAALVGAVIMGWNRSVSGMPYPQQVWEKTVRLAGWGGIRPQPGQTPHDYARRLGKRFLDVREDLPILADAYTKSRFGHKELSEQETAAIRDAWPEVRSVLIGGITGRFFRRRDRDS